MTAPEKNLTAAQRAQLEADEAEAAELETREARAAAVAKMDLDTLRSEATDDELHAEARRVSRLFESRRSPASGTHRPVVHERLNAAFVRCESEFRDAVWKVREETARRHDGPTTASLMAAHTLGAMVRGTERAHLVDDLRAAIDTDDGEGKFPLISADDKAGEWSRMRREWDTRRDAIGAELDARRQAATLAGSGRAERVLEIARAADKQKRKGR